MLILYCTEAAWAKGRGRCSSEPDGRAANCPTSEWRMVLWHSAAMCSSKTVYNDIIGYPPVHPRSRIHHERAGHAGVSGIVASSFSLGDTRQQCSDTSLNGVDPFVPC